MAAFAPLGSVATIAASTSSATCLNTNTSAPGAYIANRCANWVFVVPISTLNAAATVPMSTTTPAINIAVPPNSGFTVKLGGQNVGWAAIVEPGGAAGNVHITPTDGQE